MATTTVGGGGAVKKKREYIMYVDPETFEVLEVCMPKTRICLHCGTTFKHDKFKEYTPACPDCLKNGKPCSCCGTLVKKDSKNFREVGNKMYCKECYDITYALCGECGKEHKKTELETIKDTMYCKPCLDTKFGVCERCKIKHPKKSLKRYKDDMNSYDKLCTTCFEIAANFIPINPKVNVATSKVAKFLKLKQV